MNKNIWAIIPARGGSTGVKGKNIKKLNGKPLIAHCIETLNKSNSFDRVIVTSDCEDILSVSETYGADTFLRDNPKESDNITMPDLPTISCLKNYDKEIPDFVFMVQCTAPFIKAETYKNACIKLIENPESTVFAAEDPAGNVNVSLTKFPTSVLSDPVYTKCTTVAESGLGSAIITLIAYTPASSSTDPSLAWRYTEVGDASLE